MFFYYYFYIFFILDQPIATLKILLYFEKKKSDRPNILDPLTSDYLEALSFFLREGIRLGLEQDQSWAVS
jgi:hypothetical protein